MAFLCCRSQPGPHFSPLSCRDSAPVGRRAAAGFDLRSMTDEDAATVRDFLVTQYEAFNAIDNTPEGHAIFHAFVSAESLRGRLAGGSLVHLAHQRGCLVGVCEIHRDGYLTLLYVRGDRQGLGLGHRLLVVTLDRLRAASPGVRRIRVRATPYARAFYTRVGFQAKTHDAKVEHGMRFHLLDLMLDDPDGTVRR